MRFSIRSFKEGTPPAEFEETLVLPDFARENVNVESISSVEVSLIASAESQVIFVSGTAKAEVEYECCRCLKTYRDNLVGEIREGFTERPDKENVEEDIHLLTSEWVDMDEYVAESLQLALVYKPLCRPDCKGLCEQCGHDLNVSDCGCEVKHEDPRLEALRDLLSAGDSE